MLLFNAIREVSLPLSWRLVAAILSYFASREGFQSTTATCRWILHSYDETNNQISNALVSRVAATAPYASRRYLEAIGCRIAFIGDFVTWKGRKSQSSSRPSSFCFLIFASYSYFGPWACLGKALKVERIPSILIAIKFLWLGILLH